MLHIGLMQCFIKNDVGIFHESYVGCLGFGGIA